MTENKRLSNFELLRIFAMVLIIINHIFLHSINKHIFDASYSNPGEMFSNLMVYKRLVITCLGRTCGQTGNTLFIMISGYFLIDKESIDIIKQIKKISSQVLFATIVLMLASAVTLRIMASWTGVITIDTFNNGWWFIGYYFGVILIAKLFLNKYIQKLDKEGYLIVLFVLFAVVSFGFIRGIASGLAKNLDTLISGVFFYLMGGYIKKYDPFKNVRAYVFILAMIIVYALIVISYYNSSYNSVNQAILENNHEYHQEEYNFIAAYGLPYFVLGISFFELFKRIKIKSSAIINYIAGATFMIYLMHENEFIWGWEDKLKLESLLFGQRYGEFTYKLLLIILFFMILGITAYSIYRLFAMFVTSKMIKRIIKSE